MPPSSPTTSWSTDRLVPVAGRTNGGNPGAGTRSRSAPPSPRQAHCLQRGEETGPRHRPALHEHNSTGRSVRTGGQRWRRWSICGGGATVRGKDQVLLRPPIFRATEEEPDTMPPGAIAAGAHGRMTNASREQYCMDLTLLSWDDELLARTRRNLPVYGDLQGNSEEPWRVRFRRRCPGCRAGRPHTATDRPVCAPWRGQQEPLAHKFFDGGLRWKKAPSGTPLLPVEGGPAATRWKAR